MEMIIMRGTVCQVSAATPLPSFHNLLLFYEAAHLYLLNIIFNGYEIYKPIHSLEKKVRGLASLCDYILRHL
jgi:hypothetical protein